MKRAINDIKLNALRLISRYPQDVIDLVNEFRQEASQLEVYEFRGDDLVPADKQDELRQLRKEYVYPAMHEGAFETSKEFDDLVSALDLISPVTQY